MADITVDFDRRTDDFAAQYLRAAAARRHERGGRAPMRRKVLLVFGFWFVIGFFAGLWFPHAPYVVLVAMAAVFGYVWFYIRREDGDGSRPSKAEATAVEPTMSKLSPRRLGPMTLALDADGVVTTSGNGIDQIRWAMFQSVAVDAAAVSLVIDPISSLDVPRRAFASDAELQAFVDYASARIQETRGNGA
jgi:hypothetical protein